MQPVTDTPAEVLAEAEAAIKAAAYTLEGRYPADLSAIIVGVRDLVAISGWIAQRGEAIAKQRRCVTMATWMCQRQSLKC